MSPSTARATIPALCSPVASRAISLASRIVATPIVIASRGTFSTPKKSAAASLRVNVSSVTMRVRDADAEQLEVDATGGANRFFIRGARVHHTLARRDALGNVDVLLRDVHVREEVFPHVPVIAVGTVGRHRVILVEIERDDARKIDVSRLVAADQLFVDTQGGAAGGEVRVLGEYDSA